MKAKVFFVEFGWYILMGLFCLTLLDPHWFYYSFLLAAALLRILIRIRQRKYYLEDLQITTEGIRVQYINSILQRKSLQVDNDGKKDMLLINDHGPFNNSSCLGIATSDKTFTFQILGTDQLKLVEDKLKMAGAL